MFVYLNYNLSNKIRLNLVLFYRIYIINYLVIKI